MTLHRFFASEPYAGGALPLSDADMHHLRDVLRLEAGDDVLVATPARKTLQVRLTEVSPGAVVGEIVGETSAAREPRVVLFQGIAKGPKTDHIVQRAVEVGAERIVPVLCERTVVRLDPRKAEERASRWRKIAEAAAKQSQRAFVPEVAMPRPLADVQAELAELDHVLVAWEEAGNAPGIGEALKRLRAATDSRVGIVVGPEGGLTTAEVDWLGAHGAVLVSLGPTVLRTETAGIVATALTLYELGGLGGAPRG